MKKRFVVFLVCLVSANVTNAQSAGTDTDEIVVVAANKEYPASAKVFRAAQAAFKKYRPMYAPQSQLWFDVSAGDPTANLEGLQLSLDTGSDIIAIPVGTNHRFQLPENWANSWMLHSNRRDLKLKIQPWVISSSSRPDDWRFGDIELQCRVGWAVARQSASILVTGLFDAAGGCKSSRIGIYHDLGRPVSEAKILENGKGQSISIWKSTMIRLPTYMKGFSHEARVRITYSD